MYGNFSIYSGFNGITKNIDKNVISEFRFSLHKHILIILFLFSSLFTYSQDSNLSRLSKPGIGTKLLSDVIYSTLSITNILVARDPTYNQNISSNPDYEKALYGKDILYISKKASDSNTMWFYDNNGYLKIVQVKTDAKIADLVYCMAFLGYVYKEFSTNYYFPIVYSNKEFNISISFLKNEPYIIYDISYK